jgi:hypothetical protein
MNDELERIWKEAVMVLFKKLSNIYQEGLRKSEKIMKADLRDLSIILQNILIYPNQRKAK